MTKELPGQVYKWRVLGVVMLGTVMSALDSSIVNVSLPSMMASFGADVDEIEWVVTGYMLAFSTFMPLTAWLRDRIGHRVLYVSALGIFVVGSVFCGMAWSLPSLVAARVVQALGGGAITPTGMAMIAEVFEPGERGRALGIWGVGVIMGPALGPTLGGYLTESLGWRWIFNINLPIGAVGLVLALRFLRRDRPQAPRSTGFDAPGFLLLTIFLVSALLGLSKGNAEGWTSSYVTSCGLVAGFSFAAFLAVESVVPHRVLDLALFRRPQFTIAMVVTVVRSVALYGGTFLLPLFAQRHMGLGETETGVLMLPGALVIGLVMPVSGRIVDAIGYRAPTIAGLILTAWFMFLYRDLDANTSYWGVLWPTLVRGVGLGLLVTPVMAAAVNAVPTAKAGMASSMLSLVQQVAGSIGIAALASVLGRRTVFHRAVIGEEIAHHVAATEDVLASLSERLLALGLDGSQIASTARALLVEHVTAAASILAFDDAFTVGGAIVLVGIVPAVLLRRTAAPISPSS